MDNHFADPDMFPVKNDEKQKRQRRFTKETPPSFFKIFATIMKSKDDGDGFCGQELFSVTFLD